MASATSIGSNSAISTTEPPGASPFWKSAVWLPLSANTRWRLLLPPTGLALLGVLALNVDVPLAQFVKSARCPPALRELLEMVESFGHGIGVLLYLTALWFLDPVRRWTVPRMLVGALGAGLIANVPKMLVARTRPNFFDLAQGDVWGTFGSWLPLHRLGNTQQSCPSAHTATAVAFALVLSAVYPQGNRLFASMAVLVAVQRVQCGAHFLSDVCWGAALGWLFVVVCLRPTRGGLTWADRLEARWRSCKQPAAASSHA